MAAIYEGGREAFHYGHPKHAPADLSPAEKAFWLAGWHDAEISMSGYGHYTPALHTRQR